MIFDNDTRKEVLRLPDEGWRLVKKAANERITERESRLFEPFVEDIQLATVELPAKITLSNPIQEATYFNDLFTDFQERTPEEVDRLRRLGRPVTAENRIRDVEAARHLSELIITEITIAGTVFEASDMIDQEWNLFGEAPDAGYQ